MGKKSREKRERKSEAVSEKDTDIKESVPRAKISNVRLAIAAAILAIISAGAYIVSRDVDVDMRGMVPSATPKTSSKPEVISDPEARTWALIKKIEEGILHFEKTLAAVVDGMDPPAFADLVSLIALVKHNQQFEKRNYVIAQRELIERLGLHNFLYREIEDYFLQFGDESAERGLETFAVFFPPEWSVCVRTNIDVNNAGEISSLLHEIGHAKDYWDMQEAYGRGELPGFAAMKEVGGISIQTEVKRYAYQVELLNGMIGGYFRKTVESGDSLVNDRERDTIRGFLGLSETPDNNKFVVTFLYLAQEYYSGGGLREGQVSLGFFRKVYEKYRLDKIFLFFPDGTAIRLTPENVELYEEFGRNISIIKKSP